MTQKNEIEVTEEMLAAGRIYLWNDLLPTENRNEVLVKIYRAMREVKKKIKINRPNTDLP